MKQFKVITKTIITRTYIIEANDEEEAKTIVEDNWNHYEDEDWNDEIEIETI